MKVKRRPRMDQNLKAFLYALVLLLGVFISAVAQVILKKAATKHYGSFVKEYLNVPVISAYLIFVLSTFMSIFAYKEVPLSLGPVLEATSYIYVTIFGVKIFGEKVGRKKLIALFLIIGGIIIYSLGS